MRNFKELKFVKKDNGNGEMFWQCILDDRIIAVGETRPKAMHNGKVALEELNKQPEEEPVETDFAVAPEFEETKANDLKEAREISQKKKTKMWVMANGRRTLLAHSEAGVARQMKHRYKVAVIFNNGEKIASYAV